MHIIDIIKIEDVREQYRPCKPSKMYESVIGFRSNYIMVLACPYPHGLRVYNDVLVCKHNEFVLCDNINRNWKYFA